MYTINKIKYGLIGLHQGHMTDPSLPQIRNKSINKNKNTLFENDSLFRLNVAAYN